LHREVVAHTLPEDPEIKAVVQAYYTREAHELLLKASLLKGAGGISRHYVTAERCASCHAGQVAAWHRSKHARAALTLKEKQRLTAECLSCHSEYYRRSGAFDASVAEAWQGVECAACHGDGVLHAALGTRNTISRAPRETVCRGCHDATNDPNFNYRTYLDTVRH
jgi:predicted CxxxxCH...CXXCH cytochrome family protein